MKNRKIHIFIAAVICIIFGSIVAAFLIKRNTATDGDTVTCYEWLEMLGEQVGMEEPYVSSAVEWKVLDSASDFEGEDDALGAFIALTAMKSVGESKLQIYLDTKEPITDDAYIALAIEHGLMEEESLSQKFSEEACKQVLETLKGLQFGVFWRDDYEEVTYRDHVVELPSAEVLQCNEDGSEIVVSQELCDSLETGTVIVFEQERTGFQLAKEVSAVGMDGTLSLKSVELDQAVEEFTVSDIREVTFEDIVNYYGFEKATGAENANIINTAVFSEKIKNKGFKILVSTEGESKERHLEVKVTDNATNVSYTLPIAFQVNAKDTYQIEVDVDRIYVGAQADYSALSGLKYAEAAVDAHATFTGEIAAEVEKEIPIFKTPVPLGSGVVGVDIQICMVLSMEGGVSFKADLPIEASVVYERGKGIKNYKHENSFQYPTIEADCTAGVAVRFEPTLVVLDCINVIDVEFDIGVEVEAQLASRPNKQICADLSISFPIITISVCGDDEADTLIGNIGLSAEWEIITSDNAPLKGDIHYETYPDKAGQLVAECTYKEENEDISKEASTENDDAVAGAEEVLETADYGTYELPIRLWITTPFEDHGTYYTVRGNMQIDYTISCKDFEQLHRGDSFTLLDKEFIMGEEIKTDDFPSRFVSVYCVEDDRTYYIQAKTSYNFGSRFLQDYYMLTYTMEEEDTVFEEMNVVSRVFGEQEFRIEKDTYITSNIDFENHFESVPVAEAPPESFSKEELFAYYEEQRRNDLTGFSSYAHTAQECFENHIYIDDWIDITRFSTVYGEMDYPINCYVIFDKNGAVDTIMYASYE